MLAAAEAPIPTKTAAAALKAGSDKTKPGSVVAKTNPAPEPLKPATPARIMVADADVDSPSYTKVLGSLLTGKASPTPAADAATIPAAAAAPETIQPAPKSGKATHTAHAITVPTVTGAVGQKAKVAAEPAKAGKPPAAKAVPAKEATAKDGLVKDGAAKATPKL